MEDSSWRQTFIFCDVTRQLTQWPCVYHRFDNFNVILSDVKLNNPSKHLWGDTYSDNEDMNTLLKYLYNL